jgi:hypothetical protein
MRRVIAVAASHSELFVIYERRFTIYASEEVFEPRMGVDNADF